MDVSKKGLWIRSITEAKRTNRNAPHIQQPGACYACVSRTAPGKILSHPERDIVFDSINFLNGTHYDLHGAVVMPDHFHLVVQPLMETSGAYVSLPRIFHSLKSYTGHKITQRVDGRVWQSDHYDRIIRNEQEYHEQLTYIRNNPLEAGLVGRAEDYKWLWHVGMNKPP